MTEHEKELEDTANAFANFLLKEDGPLYLQILGDIMAYFECSRAEALKEHLPEARAHWAKRIHDDVLSEMGKMGLTAAKDLITKRHFLD